MQTYTCPTCGESMERDLVLFVEHTDRHILAALKKNQPAWITKDGYCPKCFEYFKRQMRDPKAASSGTWEMVNIGPREVQKRAVLAVLGAGGGLLMLVVFKIAGLEKNWRSLVFFPFFMGALGYLQAQEKLCVINAQKNIRVMDDGKQPVSDVRQAAFIRQKSFQIWALSVLVAAVLSLIAFLL